MSVMPEAMLFTRTPLPASSIAAVREIMSSAALLAEYVARNGAG